MKLTLQDRLLKRELGDVSRYSSIPGLYGDKAWIDGLDIVDELGGHSGCVNALSWSRSGALLASGSDDQHLNIHSYQPDSTNAAFALTTTIATGHSANIFSVKFMPHSNDRTLVTCAGDSEVRIFDIEYAGRSTVPSAAANLASSGRSRGYNNLYNGVRYLSDGDTNTRVYRSHADRVKRIVTESSPHLFLSCSEDGEVRQWDLRLPSSAYPAPRSGRGFLGNRSRSSQESERVSVPPPLISYKRYHLDLNTISCSASQPHYIALGGAHLHCFLHDRRMLGRDLLEERGALGSVSPASGLSEHDDNAMGEATRCVRRFAPNGKKRMQKTDNGHITACKISDANPNEMIASWSGDHIYSFDLVQTHDVRDSQHKEITMLDNESGTRKVKESRDRKRKRKKQGSDKSTEGAQRELSKAPRVREQGDDDQDLALRVRYGNGQSEDISLGTSVLGGTSLSGLPQAAVEDAREAVLNESQKRSLRIAKSLVRIRKLVFSIDTAAHGGPAPTYTDSSCQAALTSVLGIAASVLPEMDEIMRSWRYPVNPVAEDVAFQQTLRSNREASRKFVQAAGTLAKVLGGKLRTGGSSESPLLEYFRRVQPAPNEGTRHAPGLDTFSYDFLKAILLWLEGGRALLLQGFKRSPDQRNDNPRFPVPESAQLSGIDEYLIPYLLRMARGRPVPYVDASRFERDEHRMLFPTETGAIIAFSQAIKISFEDLSQVVPPLPSAGEVDNTTQNRAAEVREPVAQYWGFKVARGLLMNAGEGITFALVDRAYGGLGTIRMADEGRSQEDVDPDENEDVVQSIIVERRATGGEGEDLDMNDAEDEEDSMTGADITSVTPGGTTAINGATSDEEVVLMDDLHDEIVHHMSEDDQDDHDVETGNDDDDDEEHYDGHDNEDQDGYDEAEHLLMFRSASDRGKIRENVQSQAPCQSHSRSYRGHCNVKTVKDVNFFGLQDEYVVSGSDSGHLFIWDKKTSQLLNILEGDGEVVNVIQGHPYEPMLAVSGIDHTIKIFSPDIKAQDSARQGKNLARNASSSSRMTASTLGGGSRRRHSGRQQPQQETSSPNIDDPDSDNPGNVAPNGLASRKRMHDSYKIISENEVDRQGGMRDAFITRGMLAQLAAQIRARQGLPGHTEGAGGNEEGQEGDFEGGPLVLGDNCSMM